MFVKTKEILEASESSLLGFSTNRSLLKPIQRLFIYPLAYIKVGFGDFTKPMFFWSVTSFSVLVALSLFSSSLAMSKELVFLLFNICMWIALFLTTFLTPSTYAFYGATEVSVNKIVDILNHNGVQNEKAIELFESNLERISERIESRVKFYKWIIGTFWGAYILLLNFQLRFLSLTGKSIDDEMVNSGLKSFLYVAIFTTFSLIAMISYKRASNMLIANIQYACTEQKSRTKTM